MIKIYYCEGLVCGVSGKHYFISRYIEGNPFLELVSNIEDADYILYANTCAATFMNIEKVIKNIEYYLSVKKEGAKLIVCGCITKKISGDFTIINQLKHLLGKVDYVFDGDYLPQLFNLFNFSTNVDAKKFNPRLLTHKDSSIASIYPADGCLNKCTFCKSQYMDMTLHSVPKPLLMNMVYEAVKSGNRVIHLAASNLSQYGIDVYNRPMLHVLLREIGNIDEVKWIFLSELCPSDLYGELIEELAVNNKVKNISMPIQTGSDRLLKLMNRRHKIEDIRNMLNIIRLENPNLFFDSSLMCGFPTETIDDVRMTIEMVKELKLYISFFSSYINSAGVASSKLNQLSEEKINEHTIIYKSSLKPHNDGMIRWSLELPVLVEQTDGYNVRLLTRANDYICGTPDTEEEKSYFKTLKIGDETGLVCKF